MRLFLLSLCLILTCPFTSPLRADDSIRTKRLPEVSVEAEYVPVWDCFNSPVKSLELNLPAIFLPEGMEVKNYASVSDYLTLYTPAFVKETGNGMLSTIALRGTAASHTSVSWNGLSVNSRTMGQTDFSQLPLFFFDEVNLYPGGSSSYFGDGSIGGAVEVNSTLCHTDTFAAVISSSYGSFNTLAEGVKCVAANKRISSKTTLSYRRSDNDFKFTFRDEDHRQRNAAFYDYGFLQNFACRLRKRQFLQLDVWHTYYDREIQPMMQNNENPTKYESISNRSSKVLLSYSNLLPVSFQVRLGWLADKQLYEADKIATNDWLAQTAVSHRWGDRTENHIFLRLSGEFHYILPDVYAYLDDVDEKRGNVALQSNFFLKKGWLLSCALRKEFVTDLSSPLSYSTNLTYKVVQKPQDTLSLNAQLDRNIHTPTLNDRYWGRMDNHDLETERGANLQFGLNYAHTGERYCVSVQPNIYRNDVSNWILWMPRGNIWKPINVERVLAKGVECSLIQSLKGRRSCHSLYLHYAYNHTEVKSGFTVMKPFEGRQMALLPRHTLSANWMGKIGRFSYSLQGKYVGERSTSDVFDVMDGYFLLSASAGYGFTLNRRAEAPKYAHLLKVDVQLNNILGTDYQTVPYRAMPKQNFMTTLRYQVERKKKKETN